MRSLSRGVAGRFVVILAVVLGLYASTAGADDVFFRRTFQDLKLDEIDAGVDAGAVLIGPVEKAQKVQLPYVVLDGAGEAYLTSSNDDGSVFFRLPDRSAVTGRLFYPKAGGKGMRAFRFRVTPPASDPDSCWSFARTKKQHYERLIALNLPGTAWFLHREREAIGLLGAGEASRQGPNLVDGPGTGLDSTFDFFSGGRAVDENLQLDRSFEAAGAAPLRHRKASPVRVESIPGITVAEMDWSSRLEGHHPKLDSLAGQIPADQHALFLPNLRAAAGLMAHFRGDALPMLRLFNDRSAARRVQGRYARQLGVSLDDLGKFPALDEIRSVAVTGSDPYLSEGTDLAILFEVDAPDALAGFLKAKVDDARRADPEAVDASGQVDALRFVGARTPDRSLCSFVATMGKTVILTNSPAQLKRLVRSGLGEVPSLAAQPEYRFFRDRYPLGEGEESAFLILTDATIRRWCGPRWRIGESRRVRASAALAEAQAANLPAIANGATRGVKPDAPPVSIDLGPLQLGRSGVRSETYGTLGFLTPIVELSLDEVGGDEAGSYFRWRDTYQQNWRGFFDPIALRLSSRPGKVAADLSVMPLIANTDYRHFIATIGKVRLEPGSGDPHPGTLGHAVMAIDARSGVIDLCREFAGNFLSMPKGEVLAWLGRSVAVYLDDDPFWAQLMTARDAGEFLEKNGHRTPVGVAFEVLDGENPTRFLDGLMRTLTASQWATWKEFDHKGRRYAEIAIPDSNPPVPGPKWKLYCYGSARFLTFSLNEDIIKRSIDRDQSGARPVGEAAPWPRVGLALRANRQGFEVMGGSGKLERLDSLRARSWGNLPILNEWKRRFPAVDPVALHEACWGVSLVDPCGGRYVWNERWATMESTAFGHPGEPKSGPEDFDPAGRFRLAGFGLTFEDNGLRARTEIEIDPQP